MEENTIKGCFVLAEMLQELKARVVILTNITPVQFTQSCTQNGYVHNSCSRILKFLSFKTIGLEQISFFLNAWIPLFYYLQAAKKENVDKNDKKNV